MKTLLECLGMTICLIILNLIYFLPTLLAVLNHNINTLGIFFLNLFLGWTGLGWVIALIWSVIR